MEARLGNVGASLLPETVFTGVEKPRAVYLLLVVLLFGVEASPCRAVRLRNRVRRGIEQPLISLIALGRYDVELISGVSN